MKKAIRIFLILITFSSILLPISVILIRFNVLDNGVFKYPYLISRSLSDSSYIAFLITSLLLIIISGYAVFSINKWYPAFHRFCIYVGNAFKVIFKDMCNKYVLLLLIPPLVSALYFAFVMPVSYDEALTYVTFTDNPLIYSISSYPYPNNHILHSIITHITKHIPISDILFCLRFSVIIVSMFTWVVIYSFVKRYYSEKVALFTMAITSMLFMSIYYSYMSRGYALLALFFLVGLFASFNIIKHGSRNRDWMVFSISNILGFYTMPSFLYPFLTLNLLIFIFNYKNIKQQILFNIFITLATLLCYTPIILHQGFGVLTAKIWDRMDAILYFPIYFKNTFYEIFGFHFSITIILMAISLVIAILKKKKFAIILWVVFGLAPVVLLTAHSVIPFPRTFIYYGFFIVFLIGISISEYIEKINIKLLVPVLLILQIALFFNFKSKIIDYESFNIDFHDVNSKFIDKDKTFYIFSGLNIESYKFEMMSRGFDYSKSKYDRVFVDFDVKYINTDTITDNNYDYIVIDRAFDVTELRKPIYSNYTLNVYKGK